MKFREMFKCAFHIGVIISAATLTGCGYKGPPVYKEANKTIDYNSTKPTIPSNLNQY
ncbi:MAG: hypothetical protein RL154_658 [Pseudomonadota bacterium]|jgi:predicted small lipoprotein YifL